MSWIGEFGQNALNTVTGGLINGLTDMLFAGPRDARQRRLMDHQYDLNEQAAENAFNRQKALYDYELEQESPSKQVARMEAAGLNPGLMYGGVNTGVQASTSTAPKGGASALGALPFSSTSFGSLTTSQIEVNKAQAYKLRKEGDAAAGSESRAQSLFPLVEKQMQSQINWTDANAHFVSLQSKAQEVQNQILEATKEFKIGLSEQEYELAKVNVDKAEQEFAILMADAYKASIEAGHWDQKVKNDLSIQLSSIALMKAQTSQAYSQSVLNKSLAKKADAEIAKINAETELVVKKAVEQDFTNWLNEKSKPVREAKIERDLLASLRESQSLGRITIDEDDGWIRRNIKACAQIIDGLFGSVGQIVGGKFSYTTSNSFGNKE